MDDVPGWLHRAHAGRDELKNPETGDVIDSALISSEAAEVLGLNDWQADVLFEAGNTIEDLEGMVKTFIKPGYVPTEYEEGEEWE